MRSFPYGWQHGKTHELEILTGQAKIRATKIMVKMISIQSNLIRLKLQLIRYFAARNGFHKVYPRAELNVGGSLSSVDNHAII